MITKSGPHNVPDETRRVAELTFCKSGNYSCPAPYCEYCPRKGGLVWRTRSMSTSMMETRPIQCRLLQVWHWQHNTHWILWQTLLDMIHELGAEPVKKHGLGSLKCSNWYINCYTFPQILHTTDSTSLIFIWHNSPSSSFAPPPPAPDIICEQPLLISYFTGLSTLKLIKNIPYLDMTQHVDSPKPLTDRPHIENDIRGYQYLLPSTNYLENVKILTFHKRIFGTSS